MIPLKAVHDITPQCVLNRRIDGAALQVAKRLGDFLIRAMVNDPTATVRVTFEVRREGKEGQK